MIAIDTNIIVRLLTRDDEAQYQTSRTLLQTGEIYIPDTVLLETEWVLRFAYGFNPSEICRAFRNLLGLPNVTTSNQFTTAQAIDWHEQGLDFADALHLVLSQHATILNTFDETFIKKAKDRSQCVVQKPR